MDKLTWRFDGEVAPSIKSAKISYFATKPRQLQSSFNILPPVNNDSKLILEISEETVSCCWINLSTMIMEGLQSWKFDKIKDLASILENLQPKPAGCEIRFITKEFLLYPLSDRVHDPATGIDDIFGKLPGIIYERKVRGDDDIMIAFRIPIPVDEIIQKNFPGPAIQHSLSCNDSDSGDISISLVFYERQFTVRIFNNGLKLLNLYSYNSPAEVAYILLHACNVYHIDPSGCNVRVSGLIDENSKLYNELYRFFMNISFARPPVENFSEAFRAYPVHYFDHFHSLASCGS